MKQPLLPRFFLMSLLCGASMLSSGCISGCTTLFKPYEKRARAVLLPTAGNTARGTVAFVERANGVATGFIVVSDLALDGIRSVENRSIVILRLNNEASTVARRSAPRLACGVIRPQ